MVKLKVCILGFSKAEIMNNVLFESQLKFIFVISVLIFLSSCSRIMRPPDVVIRDVDCTEINSILDSVAVSDQRARTDASLEFRERVETDYENLSTVLSILESCGLPGLDQVNQTQFNAIWMVIHHSSDPKYMEKYFPIFEEAKVRGDMRPQDYATVKDRLLMRRGEPQIYGSQIRRGKLYNLIEPEYVNQRREEVGLGPIQEYLDFFNIEFDVEQKEK